MLSKKQRIPKALARDVFAQAATFSSPHFLLKVAKQVDNTVNESTQSVGSVVSKTATRFAVSVSKKVAAKAVLRNRTRRRVYSVIRTFLPQIPPGFLVAFSVKKGGEKLEHGAIQEEIKMVLDRTRLLK